jgi:hypothetical protein
MDSTTGSTRPSHPMIPPTKRKHPHFDDRGTLDWHTTFADARAAAQAEGKRLFIELGREL